MPVRLPFYYTLLSPLARLPYRVALLLWTGSTILATVFFIRLYPGVGTTQLALACCWSLPLVLSIAIGQDVAFVLLFLAATLRVLQGGKPLLAGLILSLCLIKFNLILLLPLLFLGKREWRLASGFFIGALALLAASFTAGRDWIQSYISLISNPAVSPNSLLMPTLHSLVAHIPGREFVEFFLSLAVIAIVWRIVRRARFSVALSATLLGSILLTRHAYLQDCAILLGSLVTLFEQSSNTLVRNCALVLLLPLAYVFIFVLDGSIVAAIFLILLVAAGLDEIRPARSPTNPQKTEAAP
ncbi:MAG: glycosyltransferase family 87 protein [Bryobacteraceae bacterium]